MVNNLCWAMRGDICTASGHYPLGVKVKMAQACVLSMKFILKRKKKKCYERGAALGTRIFVILMECKQISVLSSRGFHGLCSSFSISFRAFCGAGDGGGVAVATASGTAGPPVEATVAPPAVHKLHSRYFYLL